jgi:hypothetical protein
MWPATPKKLCLVTKEDSQPNFLLWKLLPKVDLKYQVPLLIYLIESFKFTAVFPTQVPGNCSVFWRTSKGSVWLGRGCLK